MASDSLPSGSLRSRGSKNVMVKDPWMKGTPSYIVPRSLITRTAGVGMHDTNGKWSGETLGSLMEHKGADAVSMDSGGYDNALQEIAVRIESGEVFVIPPKLVIPTRGYESYERQAKRDFIRPFVLCRRHVIALGGNGMCPSGKNCGAIHVNNDEFKLDENLCHTPCCWHHGDSLASKSVVPAFVIDGLSWKLPAGRWARTRSQDRHVSATTKLRESDICLRHIQSKCHEGRNCTKSHICRVWTQKVRLADSLLKDKQGSDSSETGGTVGSSGTQNNQRTQSLQVGENAVQWQPKEGDRTVETRSNDSSGEEKQLIQVNAQSGNLASNQESSDSGSASGTGPSGETNGNSKQTSGTGGPQEGSSRCDLKSSTVSGSASRESGTGSSEDFDPTKTVNLCKYFLEGSCKAEAKCKAAHVDPDFIDTCRLKHNTHGEVVVQDGAGRVFTVPYGDILQTQGLEAYKRQAKRDYLRPFPLCPEFHADGAGFDGCADGVKCSAIHIDLNHYKAIVSGPLRTPCCRQHGDTLCTNLSLIAGLLMNRHIWRFPAGRMARTAAPELPAHWAQPEEICTAHLWGKCKAGRDCTKYHVCRIWLRKVRLANRLTQQAQQRRQAEQTQKSGDSATIPPMDSQSEADEESGGDSCGTNGLNGRSGDSNSNSNEHVNTNGQKSSNDDRPTLLSSMDGSDLPLLCSDHSSSEGQVLHHNEVLLDDDYGYS